jgi:hypothetical protein
MSTAAVWSNYGEFIPLILATLWTVPWKGVALWKAARRGDTIWFIALLVVNTLALLEILYIFVFSKRGLGNSRAEPAKEAPLPTRS